MEPPLISGGNPARISRDQCVEILLQWSRR